MAFYVLPDEEIRRNVIYLRLKYSRLFENPKFKKSRASAGSSLGLVSTFCSKSRSRGVKVSTRSRKFWPRLQLC